MQALMSPAMQRKTQFMLYLAEKYTQTVTANTVTHIQRKTQFMLYLAEKYTQTVTANTVTHMSSNAKKDTIHAVPGRKVYTDCHRKYSNPHQTPIRKMSPCLTQAAKA